MTALTLADEIAWMREQADFLQRNADTLVGSGRLTAETLDRRLALANSIIGRLEQMQDNLPTALKRASVAGTLKTPMALVRLSCGPAFEDVAVLNVGMVLKDRRLLVALTDQIVAKLLAVIRQGLRRPE